MSPVKARIFKLTGILFAISCPLLIHIALTHNSLTAANRNAGIYALILIQVALSGSLAMAFVGPRYRWLAIIGIVLLGLTLCVFRLSSGLALSSGLPHAMIYFGLLILFGVSLMPGREPIVSFFSRTIHGHISIEVKKYTRHVTYAWCLFFGAQLLGSAILILFAPLSWWSAFVNLFNIPLIILMFLGERLSRPFWVANPPHEYVTDMMKVAELVTVKMKSRGQAQP